MSFRFLLCLITVCFLFGGCSAARSDNTLSYQQYPLEATGTLFYDEHSYEVSLRAEKAGDLRLTFVSPASIQGLVIEKRDGVATISYEGIEQAFGEDSYLCEQGVLLAAAMFSLTSDDYSGAGVVTEGESKLSYADFTLPSGAVRVLFAEGESRPCRIDATLNGHRFSFTFMNEE